MKQHIYVVVHPPVFGPIGMKKKISSCTLILCTIAEEGSKVFRKNNSSRKFLSREREGEKSDMNVKKLREFGRKKNARNQVFIHTWDVNNLLIIFLLLFVNGGLGNTIQITLAALGDPSATLLLVNLKNTDLLKGLEDPAVNLTGGLDVVGWGRATVLGRSVDLAEAANTDSLAHVDVTSDGGSANVEPIGFC
jgi:hypothetical protein